MSSSSTSSTLSTEAGLLPRRTVLGSKLGGWLREHENATAAGPRIPSENRGALRVPPGGRRPPWPAVCRVLDDYVAALAGSRSRRIPAHLSVEGAPVPRLARRRRGGRRPLTTPAARDWAVRDYAPPAGRRQTRPRTVNNALAAVDDFYTRRGLGARMPPVPISQVRARALSSGRRYGSCARSSSAPPARPGPRLIPFYAGARIAETVGLDVDDVKISAARAPPYPRQGRKGPRGPLHRRCVPYSPTGWPNEATGPARTGGTAPQPTRRRLSAARRRHHHRIATMPTRRRSVSAHPLRHTFVTTLVARHRPGDRRRAGRHAAWRPPGRTACPPTRTRPKPEPAHHRPVTEP